MHGATLWWLASGVAVVCELATGTFYLLMIALGTAAGAILSWAGAPPAAQLLAAALVAGGATALLRWRRSRDPRALDAPRNRDVNLDIGAPVRVEHWGRDGSAQVQLRGSAWLAKRAPGAAVAIGGHRVVAVEGNWLVVEPAEPDPRPAATNALS